MAENVDIIVRGKDHASKAFESARQSLDGLGKAAGQGAGGAANALDGLSNATAGAASKMGGLVSAVGGVGTAIAGTGIATAIGAVAVSIGGISAALVDVSGKAADARNALQDFENVNYGNVLADAELLSTRYGVDMQETLDATRTLMDEFGLSSDDATAVMVAGFESGLNTSDDFLDTISEYSNLMADNGFSAAEFFSIMDTGMAGGVLGTDKAADALKEFGIKMREVPDTLFGPKGSLLTSGMFTGAELDAMVAGFEDGSVTMADAFSAIMPRLREVDNEVERNAIGVKLFGTQWEDLGMSAMLGIDDATTSMDELTATAEAGRNRFASLGEIMPRLWSEFTVAVLPAADVLLDLANRVAPTLLSGMRWLGATTSAFVTSLRDATSEGGFLSTMVANATPFLERFGSVVGILAGWFVNSLLPALWSAAQAIGTALGPVFERIGGVMTTTIIPAVQTFVGVMAETLPPIIDAVGPILATLIDVYLARLATYLEAGAWLWTNVLGPAITGVAAWITNDLMPALSSAADTIGTALAPHIETLAGFITGTVVPAIMTFGATVGTWIIGAIEKGTPIIVSLVDWFVTKLMPALISAGSTIMTALMPRLQSLWQFAQDKIIPIVMKVVQFIGDNLPGAINTVSPIIAFLVDVGLTNLENYLRLIVLVWDTALQPALSAMLDWVGRVTGGWGNLTRGAKEAQRIVGDFAAKIRDLFSVKLPAWLTDGFKMPKFELPRLPGFAGGVTNFSGGAAIVGERGPELVTLPRGSNVIPATQTRQIMAQPAPTTSGATVTLTVAPTINGMTVDNADRVQQVAQQIAQQVQRSLERDLGRAVDQLILGGGTA